MPWQADFFPSSSDVQNVRTILFYLQRVAFPVRLVPTVPFLPWRLRPPSDTLASSESSPKETFCSPLETLSARRISNTLFITIKYNKFHSKFCIKTKWQQKPGLEKSAVRLPNGQGPKQVICQLNCKKKNLRLAQASKI